MEAMATERLGRMLRSAAADAAGGDPDALRELRELADRVEAVAEHAPPGSAGAAPERLRAALLERWLRSPHRPSPAEAARVLAALDAVRAAASGSSTSHDEASLTAAAEFAHDLRSPLTSILFVAGSLREGQSGPLTAAQRRQAGIIYSAALGLVSMATDLVEISRAGPDDDRAPFSVRAVMESVRDVVAPLAEEKRVELRLGPPQVDHRQGDAAALGRVLLNLAVNALHSTEDGWVEITAEADGDRRLRFQVLDNGPGIEPERLSTLFSPFRPRVRRPGFGFSGTGLGLGICRRVVAQMGGE
ncbi:MAG: sensor histidine kinase, partial [Longimicrobiaceae bacterium]